MSRIHEALKKAEQERAIAQGGSVDPSYVRESRASETAPTVVMDQPPVAETDRIPTSGNGRVSEAPFGVFTEEMLETRSVLHEWKPRLQSMLFFGPEENVRGTEQFRTLRSRFYAMRERLPLKTILVASALPNEGKSFVAANLAQVLARQEGRRVLLIDGDMRKSSLHTALGTNLTPGLGDYLLGEFDELSAMQRGPMDNLFFMPSGRTVEHPAELIGNGRLGNLIQRVGHLFEWIVIDSPPAVPVSDASQLSKFVDGVLMVVRSNETPYDSAQRAQREFDGKPLVGVVLNGMMRDSAYPKYVYEAYEKPFPRKAPQP